jgi:CHAT domain-containing protein
MVIPATAPTAGFERLENTDLPYNDYRSGMDDAALKGIDLESCERACGIDQVCRAYTYNSKARVCFLKTAAADPSAFSGAFSGIKNNGGSSTATLWETDPTLLVAWAQQTIADYRPENVTIELPDARALGADTAVLLLDGPAFDLSEIAAAVRVRTVATGAWGILARRGQEFVTLETDSLGWPGEYAEWLRDVDEWRAKYDQGRAADVAAWVPQLEQMVTDLETEFGAGNPLAAYVKLDLVTAVGLRDLNVDARNQQIATLLDEAVHDLAVPFSGSEEIAAIFHRRAAAALMRRAKPRENCNIPDTLSKSAYERAAALLHHSGAGVPWIVSALSSAATCAETADKARLFGTAASYAGSDDVLRTHSLMHLGVALAAQNDADRARAAFRAGISLRNGAAYAEAFPWMREWFEEDELIDQLGLSQEFELTLAHHLLQSLGSGAETNTAARSGYLFMARVLERRQRHDVADMFYAAVAPAWDGKPQAVAMLVSAQAIDERDYAEADAMLERWLELTPPGADDNTRLRMLAQLAESNQLSGEFNRSADYAQQALLLTSSGTVSDSAALRELVPTLEAQARQGGGGESGRAAADAIDRFTDALEGACETGFPVPDLPVSFLDGEVERSLYFPALATQYVECAGPQFADRFMVEQSFAFSAQLEVQNYFRTLLALGQQDVARTHFTELMAARPVRQEREDHIGWATERKLDRLLGAIRASILEADMVMASEMLHQVVAILDDGLMQELISLTMAHDALSGTILMLKTIGEEDEFLRLARIVDADRMSEQLGTSCYGPICELALEMRASLGDAEGVEEYTNDLHVGLVIAMSGAGADSKETDEIMAVAEEMAVEAMRFDLPTTAFAYFRTAEARSETILSDDAPLSSLKKVSAAGAYAEALLATGQTKSAFAVAQHLLTAARSRVSESELFADDALLIWSRRLADAFEVFLASAPVDSEGRYSGDVAQDVLFAVQFLQATGTSATLGQLAARGGSSNSSYRSYLDLAREIDSLLEDFGEGSASPALAQQIAQLRQEQRTIADTIAADDPDFFRFGRLQFADSRTIIASLRPAEAISTAFSGKHGLVRIWLDQSGLLADRTDIRRGNLTEIVTQYRQSIIGDGSQPVRADLGHDLFEIVFGSFADRLRGVEHLVFVPNGSLDGLPLPALLTSTPPHPQLAGDQLVNPTLPWLIRTVDIAALPSLSAVLVMRKDLQPSAAPNAFLGVGNPAYAYTDPVYGALSPLPETEAEVRFMAALLGANSASDLILGPAATKAALLERPLDQYRLITFATHGFVAQGLTGSSEPGLALAGTSLEETLLSSSDVASLKLDADLVILSACSTASSDGTPGAEGLSGLASAFFYAGSRGLLVTHWDIPSGPALELTTGMISAHEADNTTGWPAALRSSIITMLDMPKTELHAHPVSWAGHFLVTAQ